jgi:hypothetical protein
MKKAILRSKKIVILKTPWGTTTNRENEEDIMPNEAHAHKGKDVGEAREEVKDFKSVTRVDP